MGLYLNPGNEEFRNAAIHSKIYVDKTEMIKFTNSQLSQQSTVSMVDMVYRIQLMHRLNSTMEPQ